MVGARLILDEFLNDFSTIQFLIKENFFLLKSVKSAIAAITEIFPRDGLDFVRRELQTGLLCFNHTDSLSELHNQVFVLDDRVAREAGLSVPVRELSWRSVEVNCLPGGPFAEGIGAPDDGHSVSDSGAVALHEEVNQSFLGGLPLAGEEGLL